MKTTGTKIILLAAVLMSATLLGACGQEKSTADQTPPVAPPVNSTDKPTDAKMPEPTADKTAFEQFEEGMAAAGFEFETVKTDASLVGGTEGMKYKFADGKVELYTFDKSSDAYKTAESSSKLSLEGFGDFDAIVENGMALLLSCETKSDKLTEIYKNLTAK